MPPDFPVLQLDQVSKRFGDVRVLHALDLTVQAGEFVALVGPSGCGKTTLLRAILGTQKPTSGRVLMNGEPVQGPGRDRGIVYQRYALYPHLTARDNIAFGLKLDRTTLPGRLLRPWRWWKQRAAFRAEADAWLARVGLPDAGDRYPAELSGGMRQRVAFAAARIMDPALLLLDEPFGALDEATRESLQRFLLSCYAENLAAKAAGDPPPHTILIVTHELSEAVLVADRVVGLSQHWDWRAAGHDACPGATIVFDAPAPVFDADGGGDRDALVALRDRVRREVFN